MLILTAPVDPTTDVVIQHLAAAGVPFARFDAAQFPMEISFTAILHADGGWRSIALMTACFLSRRPDRAHCGAAFSRQDHQRVRAVPGTAERDRVRGTP